ncbi:MAG: efflux transporter outer membrane subunit [Desulfobacter sp.]|nr:MAG: efflux transporter outer membrane subunit [Desulfobacter sp.]
MKNYFIIISMLLILIQGCGAVGPDFVPPEVNTPANFRFADKDARAVEDLKWWEMFNDPVLYQLVVSALENNRDLKIALSRIEEARAAFGFTRADQYPGVDIQAGGSIGNFSGARSATTNSTVYISPMLQWELDLWGKFKRSSAAAQAQILASEYGVRAVETRLISDVASAYYLLLDYHQRLEISKETYDSRMKSLDIIQQRFDKGIIPEIDLNQAQIQKEIAQGAIPTYERMIAKTEHVLALLLGQLPSALKTHAPIKDQSIPPYVPSVLPSDLLERRPEIQQSLALLHVQNEEIGVAVAQRFPAISLSAGLGLASSELSNITNQGGIWTGSAGLLGPLFDYNKAKHRVEIEEEQTRQALFTYENTVLKAFAEVEDALVEVNTYGREKAAAGRKVAAAENAADLSFERYDKGVSSYLEVLDSERTLFSVRLEFSQINQLFLGAYVKLYKALGGGWVLPDEARAGEKAGAAPQN